MKLFCNLVGVAGSPFSVTIDGKETVDDLKDAIKNKKRTIQCDADELKLYLAKDDKSWLKDDIEDAKQLRKGICTEAILAMMRESDEMQATKSLNGWIFDKCKMPEPAIEQIHVLVVVPTQNESLPPNMSSDKIWYGVARGTSGHLEGVDPYDSRTLTRSDLCTEIIKSLDYWHVQLVKSPPMTGKTSLATLVCRDLEKIIRMKNRTGKIFSLSGLSGPDNFREAFKVQCKFDWESITSLQVQGYTIYLVVDEVQVFYKNSGSSPNRKSATLWDLVKHVRTDGTSNFRILLFASYGSNSQYSSLSTPVDLTREYVLGIESLVFRSTEIGEYASKWFLGYSCLGDSKNVFCDHLEWLTGGHVGLCVAAIAQLNEEFKSDNRSGSVPRSATKWIQMLEKGWLKEPDDHKLFDALIATRAVRALNTINGTKLDDLERSIYGDQPDTEIIKECIQKGIVVQNEDQIVFSSPVMWRYFVKLRVGHIERATYVPQTLPDLIKRVLGSINYDSIHQTLGRSLRDDIVLERAWQMEFYKASYRCTPRGFVTSADVGALFGSRGFIDFTIHCGDKFWGIELLRQGNHLLEHIQRFASGGQYSLLQLSDFCLVDFRRVSSVDDATKEPIASVLKLSDKLFVVCYESNLPHVAVFNAGTCWNIPIPTQFAAGC